MTTEVSDDAASRAVDAINYERLTTLVQEVCRIPSILGDEGPLAKFLFDVMKDSGFEKTALQDVLPDRPNTVGEVTFGAGPRVVMTGHMDTKPVSQGWTKTEPFSGDIIDKAIYGHGIMDMKAALVCQIVAMEALRDSGIPLRGSVAMAAVSDHMGDQLGSIAYFNEYPADLCVLGELSGNEIFLGHRGRYYFDITVRGKSAHTCHKPLAVNANTLAAHALLEFDQSRLTPQLEDWVTDLFGAETYMAPGRVYGGLPPGGPSMIPDECVIRVDCRPQPGVTVEQVREEIDRCLRAAKVRDPRFEADVTLADVKSGYLAQPGDRVVQLMRDSVRSVRGSEPPLQAAGWLGDTASFGQKVPTIIFGPGGEPVYCPDEHLSIDDIVEATQVYATFAALALGDQETR
ncbi:M20/M25/M40 family metallo-hydrolase [Streptosporangium sp. NBC_01755]|uniref:M20 family metallopeptidase n=1 Tax=unclassified Streptosporangium TaxID=2632669 RepID=UPI002DDB10E9|nr:MULTISPECIES: M20/M25/M40 family metallo-hydrolase [unclassified Streptosporangium]WSA26608.1 M20/M25/M40 family metallo-hydrolase [Streptosporangium sp. NBC_01810]WSD01968.1 M20/M25/M40 family metallo-hydrolase [Streptosporangium sp. NBC_01755]